MYNYIQVRKSNRSIIRTVETTSRLEEEVDFMYIEITSPVILSDKNSYSLDANNNIVDNGIDFNKKVIAFKVAVQKVLDSKARDNDFDSILSAVSYAALAGRYKSKGLQFFNWRTEVWAYCDDELIKIQQGLRPEPTIDEFILELPQLTIQG